MKYTRFFAAVALSTCSLGTALAQTAPAAPASKPEAQCSAEQIEANKKLAYLFDMKKDWKDAYAAMTPGYIRHNPIAKRIGDVNGITGRDEFKLLLELKDKGMGGPPPAPPGQPPEDIYHYVMANCDHVFLLKKSYLPDPQHPGQFYEVFDFDLWRVENGKLAEHWDGARIPPNPPAVMTTPIAELMKSPPPPPPPGPPPPAKP